jgi:hypothetical protein
MSSVSFVDSSIVVLSKGFTRILCDRCGKDMIVGLSCKGRGICPSCGGRRMAAGGIHAVDNVFPAAPVRQFVVTFPFELRPLLAAKASVLSCVIRIVMRVVLGWYRQQARDAGHKEAEPVRARSSRSEEQPEFVPA